MSAKKQVTAVEWYFDKIKSQFEHDGDLLETATFTYAIAKQKEKEQITDSYMMGSYDMAAKEFNPDQYYNETYGKD